MKKDPVPNKSGEIDESVILEDEVVNKATSIWTLSKDKINSNDYKEFYKQISYDSKDPLEWIHNKVEGKTEYTSLLYIPCLLYTSPSPRDATLSRMPSSA